MAYLLNIETATEVCSVCICRDSDLISLHQTHHPNSHSSQLTLLIETALKTAEIDTSQLNAVSLSAGPGSYTGLRIGASAAKGLCYALNIPLIAISTLKSMAHGASLQHQKENLFCPVIDSRGNEVYLALYDLNLNEVIPPQAMEITQENLNKLTNRLQVVFFGSGSAKLKKNVYSANAIFMDDWQNSAQHMIPLSYHSFTSGNFESLPYFEPYYLKNFPPTKNRK